MFDSKILNVAGGAITLLFRNMIKNNNLEKVVMIYINMYCDKNAVTSQDKSALRTNYKTHVNKGYMTIKIFIKLFKELFNAKYISFNVEVKYDKKVVTHLVELDLKKDNADTVYLLFKGLLANGLVQDLDSKVASYVKKNKLDNGLEADRLKYVILGKINSELMTWTTFVDTLKDVFEVDYVKLDGKVEYGKKTILEESVTIRL